MVITCSLLFLSQLASPKIDTFKEINAFNKLSIYLAYLMNFSNILGIHYLHLALSF